MRYIMKDFYLGCNYWARDWGTEMWLHYDGKKIREELKLLSEYGVRCMRVFPNWRDFQPVERAYKYQGGHGEYVNAYTGETVHDDGVDPAQIENFKDFCDAAEEYGIDLVVSIVTGWMSGKLYCPPVLNGKNLISDHEALMWMRRFVHHFVRELKDKKAIVMWDLGNECNCMGLAKNAYEAYVWAATVADSIRSEDNTRPVSSGMHRMNSGFGDTEDCWFLEEQGELVDMMTTHPYPSPTVKGDNDPYTRLRMTYLPAAQSFYYGGVAKRPAYIQESGTFSQTIGNDNMSADFLRINVLTSLVNGLHGYQWWCAWEQDHLQFPPYTWATIERQLGLFYSNGEPKPVAHALKKISAAVDKLPSPFPTRRADGVCVLSRGQVHQDIAISTLILAKQAGLDLDVAYSDNGDYPEADIYFLPAISGWQVLYRKSWDTLLERVARGATLYISYAGGQICDFPIITGALSNSVMNGTKHTLDLNGIAMNYSGKEILLAPTTAEVLATNEAGNPVLLKNKYGEGNIYFVNFALENLIFNEPDGYNTIPYYKIYETVASDIVAKKPIRSSDPNLFTTVNPESDGSCIVSLLNQSDVARASEFTLADGWEISDVLYGALGEIPACDGVIMRIKKK